jgi:ABC-type multidrug transport system ATPase subunit
MNRINTFIQDSQVGDVIRVGRETDCDVILPVETISDLHCVVVCRENGIFVRDVDSKHGTFVNEQEVIGFTAIHHGDILRLGDCEISIEIANDTTAGDEAKLPSLFRGLAIQVCGATKTVSIRDEAGVSKRNILDSADVVVKAGEFFGVLGASGSGKSTLISSLAGFQSLTEGKILINGEDSGIDSLRLDQRIAYLPQDIVIHQALPTGMILDYIVRLKGLGETSQDRLQIVESALDRVGMRDRIDVHVNRLSGGQRKRAALAAQLIGDPQLLLLDEATSGLDPATEEEMMLLFRSFAQEGKTVVCITHSPGHLHTCDRLVVLMLGKVIFCGSPVELYEFFNVDTIEEMYSAQNSRIASDWEVDYHDSRCYRANTTAPASTECRQVTTTQRNKIKQVSDLTTRYLHLQISDFKNLTLLFVQSPIIGFMIAATFGSIAIGFSQLHAAKTKEVTFLLVLSVLWCAGTASVREIVKESSILRHELRFGVGLIPYLLSKFVVLSMFAMIQAAVLFTIVKYFTELPGNWFQQAVILLATSIVGVAIGLLVSSVSGTSQRAMTVLPVLLVAQAIFSGGLARLEGFVLLFAQACVPAYWSLDGLRASLTTDLNIATYPGVPGHFQHPILGSGGPLIWDLTALALQTVFLLTVSYWVLYFTHRKHFEFRSLFSKDSKPGPVKRYECYS